MNIKFDIHTHVGVIPNSKRSSSTTIQVTPAQAAEYLKRYEITHTVILYSDYVYMEELASLVGTKLYGVKWINDPEYDSLDQGKPLYYGVKIHSHRGSYLRGNSRVYGIDYTSRQLMDRLLGRMQPNEIVYAHTQGNGSATNWATPRSLFRLACKYPHLKFIVGHSGDYGGVSSTMPTSLPLTLNESILPDDEKSYLYNLSQHLFGKQNIKDAIEYTEYIHNYYLDSSIYISHKGELLKDCKKWCIGSDFPFGSEDVYSFDEQCRRFLKHLPEEELYQRYLDTITFLETDVSELAKIHYETSPTINKGKTRGRPLKNEDEEEVERFVSSDFVSENEEDELSESESNLYDESGRIGSSVEIRTRIGGVERVRLPVRPVGRPKTKIDEATEKRPVGRPKTKVDEPIREKRPVGRPKTKVEEVKEKRPVGRPKTKVEEVKEKRPVGRPKKPATDWSSFSFEIPEIAKEGKINVQEEFKLYLESLLRENKDTTN